MTNKELTIPQESELQPSAASELVPTVMRLLRICRYRRKVIFAALYCSCLAGAAYYVVAPRYYQSLAKLLIVEQKLDHLTAVGEEDVTGNTMATHRELVVSPVVINQTIARLAPQHRIDLQGVPPQEWTKTIAGNLGASITRRTNIIDVSYRSRNPEAAAAVVQAAVQSYLDFVDENHKGASGEIVAMLTDERRRLQESLNQKQKELQHYRQSVGHLALTSGDGVVEPMIQRAVRLNEALLDAQEKRLSLQASLSSMEEALSRGEDVSQQLFGIKATLGNEALLASMGLSPQDREVVAEQHRNLLEARQDLQTASADLGPNHPRIQKLRQRIRGLEEYLKAYHAGGGAANELGQGMPTNVVRNIMRQAVEQAIQKENDLSESYEHARADASRHSDALVQLRMLERDVARDETLYDSLSTKISNLDIGQGQAPIKVTVIREPLPNDIPVSPNLRVIVVMCLLGGALSGGAIVYIQDVLDDRFASPEELAAQLRVPILAVVRDLPPLPGSGLESVYTSAMPHSQESEAFRTLRTALSVGTDVCDRILISSAEPGDGKTTISANLAVAFAQAGKRTLVIDADLRRPGFSMLMGLKGQQGVADVLASEEPPERLAMALIQRTEVEGLDILPVGLRRPNPAELLSGKAFVELLAWADSQYDRVLVDCPPVLAVSDAQIVGQLVDGAVLVVRPDKNHRRSVIRAVESFGDAGCRVLGVVANAVNFDKGGYGYGYGNGYGYGYSDGYGHDENSNHYIEERKLRDTETEQFTKPILTMPRDCTAVRPRRAA